MCDTFINTWLIVFNLNSKHACKFNPRELIIVTIRVIVFLCLVKTQRVTFPYCRHLVVILMSKYLDPSQDDMNKAGDVL